jgi:CheY-like chemotaxis protein
MRMPKPVEPFELVLKTREPRPEANGSVHPAEPDMRLSPVNRTSIQPLRILLIEDHETTREAIAMLLEIRKHEVSATGSIAEARKAAEDGKFDVVISDVGLPDGSGNELMAELRSRFGLKGIALSGYGDADALNKSEAAGFVIHLTKPVRIEALEGALAAATHAGRP